ncbi:MAG TPA: ECF transporter S component [candidate division Zixibacteria bacterium]|nr:ECF transporter S component [candidate division Zixibacteria bacterium]
MNNPNPTSQARFTAHTALYLALAVLLPIGFHAFGMGGRMFLPMHLPVLLAGFLVGPGSGLLVGLLAPSLSHILTGMPPSYAVLLMTLELMFYGLLAGLCYRRFRMNIYIALMIAMIGGRLMFGLGLFLLGMLIELPYGPAVFFSAGGPLVAGLPGIAVQLVIIPIIVQAVKRRSV